MNKISDMVISYLLKGGILGEARNIETEIDIPDSNIKVKIKMEKVTLKVIKDGKEIEEKA